MNICSFIASIAQGVFNCSGRHIQYPQHGSLLPVECFYACMYVYVVVRSWGESAKFSQFHLIIHHLFSEISEWKKGDKIVDQLMVFDARILRNRELKKGFNPRQGEIGDTQNYYIEQRQRKDVLFLILAYESKVKIMILVAQQPVQCSSSGMVTSSAQEDERGRGEGVGKVPVAPWSIVHVFTQGIVL